MTDLPATWPCAPLSEIASIQGGIQKQPKRAPRSNRYPFLRVANVAATGLDLREVHEIELFGDELERLRLEPGDLLVVEGNGSAAQIGRAAVWDGEIPDCVHQNHLIRVRPGPNLLPRYLGLVWNSPAIREELTAVASSTSGLHTLNVAKLKRIVLPLPALSEQQRIVDALEYHLSRLDAADAYVNVALRRASVLHEQLVTSRLAARSPESRPLAALLAAPLANGRSVPTLEGGFPVLRLTALKGDYIDLSERKPGAWTRDEAARFLAARGDFLVARGNGSLNLVGRGGLVAEEPDEVAFPDTLIRIRPDTDVLDPAYFGMVWNSRLIRAQIERKARTTAGIYKINQKHLGEVNVPILPIEDQRALATELNDQRRSLARLVQQIDVVRQESAVLRRALLAAAFSGKLTGDVKPSTTQRLVGV